MALAKRAVYGHVNIDSIAGPSEILVLADESANPRYVAADLLSQAEHDEMASAILITTSEELAGKVSEEADGFLKVHSPEKRSSKNLWITTDTSCMQTLWKQPSTLPMKLHLSIWRSSRRIPSM